MFMNLYKKWKAKRNARKIANAIKCINNLEDKISVSNSSQLRFGGFSGMTRFPTEKYFNPPGFDIKQ
jgi:hypothetical protein